MFFWNYLAIPKTWITSLFGSTFINYFNVFHVKLFAKNLDLILTTLLTYICSWIAFPRSIICKNLDVNYKFGSWIEFPRQLDKFLKIKPGSGFFCKYETLKLWHFCVIYFTVHDRNHELDFCDRFLNLKN